MKTTSNMAIRELGVDPLHLSEPSVYDWPVPEEGQAQGSGRGIPPFHLLDALESMPELFSRFGGHRQAAGLSLPVELVPEFRRRLNASLSAILVSHVENCDRSSNWSRCV